MNCDATVKGNWDDIACVVPDRLGTVLNDSGKKVASGPRFNLPKP